jgi:hypothetical protein
VGILKNKAANAEAANAGHQPTFEQEDGEQGAGAGEATAAIKTVTREQVAPAAPEAEATGAKETTKQPEAAVVKETEKQPAVEKAPEAAVVEEKQAPAASTSTAVVGAKPGVIKNFLSAGGGMVNPLVDLKDAFSKAGIATDYSTFPRLRVDAGCIASTEGAEAGDFIELQVLSYSSSWTVTTGDDSKDAKTHVRFSDDGKITNPAGDKDEWAGTELETYRDHLISLGFEKAAIKEYEVIYGLALDCQEADFAHKNEVVALALAPESRRKFDSYKINRALQARMGRVKETSGNPVVRWTSQRVTGKERSYFNLLPSHGIMAPVDLG